MRTAAALAIALAAAASPAASQPAGQEKLFCFIGPTGTDYSKTYQAPAALCPGPSRIRGLPQDLVLPVEVITRDQLVPEKRVELPPLTRELLDRCYAWAARDEAKLKACDSLPNPVKP